jgi:hypothetical protein
MEVGTGMTAMGSCHCPTGSIFFNELNLINIALFKPGSYRPPGETYCKNCHQTCRDCNGSSRSDCTSCLEHGEFMNGVCKCNPGYYRLGPSWPCEPCTIGCLRCNDRESCQECNTKEGWARLDNHCSCDFQRGFFELAASPNQCQC